MFILGGANRDPTGFDDLWVLEVGNDTYDWKRISPKLTSGGAVLPRTGATLTAVKEKLYLFGGQNPASGATFGDVMVLDTSTFVWTNLEVQGGLRPPARHSHSTVNAGDKFLVVFGGAGAHGALGDLWILDLHQHSWRQVMAEDMPAAREMHSMVAVDHDTLILFGGRGAGNRVLRDVAVLDVASMRWAAAHSTRLALCAHSAVALPIVAGVGMSDGREGSSNGGVAAQHQRVVMFGGFNGSQVCGDVATISGKSLEVAVLNSKQGASTGAGIGSRKTDLMLALVDPMDEDGMEKDVDKPSTSTGVGSFAVTSEAPGACDGETEGPSARFAHTAAVLSTVNGQVMVIFGGVSLQEDFSDIAVWSEAC